MSANGSALRPEDQLALLLVGTAEARARSHDRLERLLAEVDFGALRDVLLQQRLLPLVGSRIVAAGGDGVPADFRDLVDAAVGAGRRHGVFTSHVTRSLVSTLDVAGVVAVPFKGTVTAERLYGDLGMRPSSDIDLLVERSTLPAALRALAEAGYALPPGRSSEPVPALHYGLIDARGQRPVVDLHWRVHWYEAEYGGVMVGRSMADSELGRVLTPLDELAMLLLCLARDGFVGLRYLADIAAWWDAFGDSVGDGALDRVAAAHPALERVLAAAAAVAEIVNRVPLRPLLRASGRPDARGRTAIRLANWAQQGDHDQMLADQRLIDWLLSPNGGSAAFARRFVFTGRSSVVRYDHLPEDSRPPEALWRLTHPAKLLSRFVSALWRVRGRHVSAPPAR
jgi:hypothetical protein